jgi:hypothetical protein
MVTGRKVDDDGIPKIIILFDNFLRAESSKLHNFFSFHVSC